MAADGAELGGLSRLATDIQIAATRNRHLGGGRRVRFAAGTAGAPKHERATGGMEARRWIRYGY